MGDKSKIPENEKVLEEEIRKEIDKLGFYLEEIDELLEARDFEEMKVVERRVSKITEKLSDLIAQVQESKIDRGVASKSVRQWNKDTKSKYTEWLKEKERLAEILKKHQRETDDEIQREREERLQHEKIQRERQLWQEKMEAELKMTEEKLKMQKMAESTQAKLPKLTITAFKGTAADWVRFENMFTTQVDRKPISDEEKFGYLLEMLAPKVRSKISNLKPSSAGYKTAWERLKKEYGQTQLVINAHMDEIITLPVIKGTNYDKIQEFYEKISKNHDALQTLGEGDMLKGLVMTTLNKLPNVKPDLVRTDESWEKWDMEQLIDNLQKWLRRNKSSDAGKGQGEPQKRERHWFTQKHNESSQAPKEKPSPACIFCKNQHWSDACGTYSTLAKRKRFFVENKLCFNCGRQGHSANKCRSRGCYNCKAKHHTSLCDNSASKVYDQAELNGYTPAASEEKSLPAIIPVKVQGITLWAYLDTGSGRNFISNEAAKRLKLKPLRYETRQVVTVNGTKEQSMPIFNLNLDSVDGKTRENIEVAGTRMSSFTTVTRPNMNLLKSKYEHTKDKQFYTKVNEEYPIHIILGDHTYCKIRTEEVYKGKSDEPIVEGTTFGWVIHGGEYVNNEAMYVKEVNDYERLYSLDVLGVEDRGEDDQQVVYSEFKENLTRKQDGRYRVNIPWIPGAEITETNEGPCRKRLLNVERKLRQNEQLQASYKEIVEEQLGQGVLEKVPDQPTGEKIFYLPHKPVVRQDASTTKVRMVFDASAKPHPLANSINECMYTGPSLQPLLWDIMIRARMSPNLLLADLQKAFLQIEIKKEDRDAFRLLFNINDKEEHLRFTRVPFGAEASPFILGATLNHLYDQQPPELSETVKALRDNTYVDNLMKTGFDISELQTFKTEAAEITEETGAVWKYCPTRENVADLGSRGASLEKMEKGSWFTGPEWLLNEREWPEQPKLKSTPKISEEQKPTAEVSSFTNEKVLDEWDELLKRKPYWNTLRVTAWTLRFIHNSLSKSRKLKRRSGLLSTDEIQQAKEYWVRRVQREIPEDLEKPGFRLVKDKQTNILKSKGRIPKYTPTYLEDSPLVQKLIQHVHERVNHMGVANTMAAIRKNWWIPRLRSLVKKQIRECNVCKVFATSPYGATATAPLPEFRTEASRPFQHTGVDFAGPLRYKINKKEEGKAYVLLFTCATSRAVHLEVTKSQTAEEFQRKLNAFITRRTRPERIVSDNAATFRATADWIKKIRRSERLQDFLADQEITWQFNLSKSPWWGGMYERIIREIKKTLYKTVGKTPFTLEQLEDVIMDIEKHLNNRPLTYIESDFGEEVLTPNVIMFGQNAHQIENIEVEDDEVTKMFKRQQEAKQHAWQRWKREYLHSLMESHRINRKDAPYPEIGEIVLVVGEEKNRGEWKKGKVVQHIHGRDGVIRGVKLQHNKRLIERPLNLVCPLEIKSQTEVTTPCQSPARPVPEARNRRKAAEDARAKIAAILEEEED